MGNLQDELKDIKEALLRLGEEKDKVKEKKWRFPFGKKVGKGQKKKNFVTVLTINENGIYLFNKYQIEDQTIMHDMIPRLATSGHVLWDSKGNPLVILPSWSVEPFSPNQHYENSLVNGSNSTGYRILMAKMLKENVNAKKQISGIVKWIVGLGLVAIIIYAAMTSGGG